MNELGRASIGCGTHFWSNLLDFDEEPDKTQRVKLSFTNWAENQPNIYGDLILSALEDMSFAVSNHFTDDNIRAYAFCVQHWFLFAVHFIVRIWYLDSFEVHFVLRCSENIPTESSLQEYLLPKSTVVQAVSWQKLSAQ